MGRNKIVTRAERTLLRTELEDAEDALRRTGELLGDEPATLREGVEAKEKVRRARSELARVQAAAESVRQTPGRQLIAEADRAAGREVSRQFGLTATQVAERLASAEARFEDFDRTLAANRTDRAGDRLEEAGAELRAAKTEEERLREQIDDVKRKVDEAPESDWLDVITALIPVEVIAGWTAIQAIIGVEDPALAPRLYWAVFAVVLGATYLHVRQDFREDDGELPGDDGGPADRRPTAEGGRRRPDLRTIGRWSERVQTALAVGAFVVWVYYQAGPFAMAGLHDPTLAAVLLPLYTLAGVQLVSSYTTVLARTELGLRRFAGVGV